MRLKQTTIFVLLLCNFALPAKIYAANASAYLLYPQLVNRLYSTNQQGLSWTGASPGQEALRNALLQTIEQCAYMGLDKGRYHYEELSRPLRTYNDINADKVYTDAAIALMKDVYAGRMTDGMLGYDGVSAKYEERDNAYLLEGLLKADNASKLDAWMASLEPGDDEYKKLKAELAVQMNNKVQDKIRALGMSLNYYRRIHHYKAKKFITVNICSTMLRYYEEDNMVLDMKVVVGKPATKTPRFAAYCYEAIMYPYWNVPHSIAVKEIIPKYRRNRNALRSLNLQVIDSRGQVADASSAIASGFKGYRFRQSTGCDNALGVLKFNISDPYSVYMHDTDYKNAFKLNKRYLSHGCIRLEKPLELGDHLLPGKINKALLQACVKSQTPTTVKIDEPVPVFVIYMPVEIQNDTVTYHKDIYRLL